MALTWSAAAICLRPMESVKLLGFWSLMCFLMASRLPSLHACRKGFGDGFGGCAEDEGDGVLWHCHFGETSNRKTERRDGIQTNNSSFSSSMVRREDRGGRIEGNLRMTSHVIVDGYYPNGLSIYQKFLLSERTRVLQHAIIRYEHDERNGILESKMEILLPFPVN